MNFYQKHIGDFNNATRHLARAERSLYSDAIELYYDTEKPLTTDFNRLARLLLANTEEEKKALAVVLEEFFVLTDEGYFHQRCHDEIQKYYDILEKRKRAGHARAASVSTKPAHADQVVEECSATNNHKPITNNHKPIKKNTRTAEAALRPPEVSETVWEDFLKIRKSKRVPLTETALVGIRREAEKARVSLEQALLECCNRGWAGFKAEWVAAKATGSGFQRTDGGDEWLASRPKAGVQ